MKVLILRLQEAINLGNETDSIRLAKQLVGEKTRRQQQNQTSVLCSLTLQPQRDPQEEENVFS